MTPADWQTLAERFEAADEETIYECVRDLLCFVTLKRGRITYADTIDRAENIGLPDLLLGVVVACVPEGCGLDRFLEDYDGNRYATLNGLVDAPRILSGRGATNAAALGAAVCRAWAEVAGGKEVVG